MLNAGDVESPKRTAVFARDSSIGVLKPNNVSGRGVIEVRRLIDHLAELRV